MTDVVDSVDEMLAITVGLGSAVGFVAGTEVDGARDGADSADGTDEGYPVGLFVGFSVGLHRKR